MREDSPTSARRAPSAPFFLLVVLLLVLVPSSAMAQLGGLRDMVRGGKKGEVYGLDVREMGHVVFVVDLSIPVEFTPEQRSQLRDQLALQAGQFTQQQLVEKGGEYAALMAGPAGSIVKTAIVKRRDKVGTARRQVKSAIDGLADDQQFGLVTFEGDLQLWHDALVAANDEAREEAKEVVELAQGGKDEGGLLGFGVSTLRESFMAASGLALQREMMAAGVAAPGAVLPAGMPVAMTAGMPATLAGALPTGLGMATSPAPALPSSAFAPAPGAFLLGIEKAMGMAPDAIVLVVGGPPPGVEDEAFLAQVAEWNAGKFIVHVAEFGSDDGSALYRALAEQNGGRHVHP
jgi:hypothetical protein